MSTNQPSQNHIVKKAFLVIITLLLATMVFCFYIGAADYGCAAGFLLIAVFSIFYRVFSFENAIYIDRHGARSDYDRSKLPS